MQQLIPEQSGPDHPAMEHAATIKKPWEKPELDSLPIQDTQNMVGGGGDMSSSAS